MGGVVAAMKGGLRYTFATPAKGDICRRMGYVYIYM